MFVYNAITNSNEGYDEPAFFLQNSIHPNGTNSFSLQNINQSQFGRYTNIQLPLNSAGNDMNDLSFNTESFFSL